MPSTEREGSRDSDGVARHQHSWSESGRSSVPMWDSSDPERAPPPLPLNPTYSPTTKANTSAGIAAAAKAIVERARESQPLSSYTSNNTSAQGSPERSLIKGAQRSRLQTLQTGNVKGLRDYVDNRSPERSPERPASSAAFARVDSKEDLTDRSSTPTPAPRDPLKDTPHLTPTTRPPPRPLLGENTPPSATMMALRTMSVPDVLSDVTNNPTTTPTPARTGSDYVLTTQIQNLTTIAHGLQKEMAALSRRSKDNAADLLGLKDATNKRDEDIRKSLRQLTVEGQANSTLLGPPGDMARSTSSFASFLDNKPWNSPPSAAKSYSVPRAASAHSFLDERIGSPSPYSVEGAASVAMLEKIIREMVTKEGQERLQSSLSELLEKSRNENTQAAKKVEELSQFIKDNSNSQALVHVSKEGPPRLDLNFESPSSMPKTRDAGGKEARILGKDDEMVKLLDRIKESVTHTGGTTTEVKTLVRDLRGEVLGMGRNLGEKLEKVSQSQLSNDLDRSIATGENRLEAEEVQSIIDESMAELKAHIAQIMRQRANDDDNTFRQLSAPRSGPDSDEMLAVVKHALSEHSDSIVKREPDSEQATLDREQILEAVKDGLKDFEPDISIQQFGLEREQILDTLKEGFAEYTASRADSNVAVVDKGDIFEAVQEALKDFRTPLPQEQIEEMKEEMLSSVREALEAHQPQAAAATGDDEATRLAVLEVVKEGLASHGPAAPREIEISREDLFDAVKASLDGSSIPFGGLGEQVLQQLHELIDGMRSEFQQYIAANGRDTEQVLDAIKDGLENLRAAVETYVDRAQDVTGKDEIVETVKGGLEQLRTDVQGFVLAGPSNDVGKGEMLEYLRTEFEHLHEVIGSRETSRGLDEEHLTPNHAAAVILAIKEGMDEMKSHVANNSRGVDEEGGRGEEMLEAMKEEFDQLKTAILNANAHDKSEMIESIQDSLAALHARFNGSELSNLSGGATEDIINEMHSEFAQLKESLHSIIGDADRDAIVSGVRQSIDDLRTQLSADQSDAAAEALSAIKEELENFKETMGSSVVVGGANRDLPDDSLTLMIAKLDEIKDAVAKDGGEIGVTDELLEAIQGEFDKLRGSIATSVIHGGAQEEVLDAIRLGLDDLRSHIDNKVDDPEQKSTQHGELLDAINDGLETMRSDVIKTLDKPLDMTVNYEILDTLKDGLAGLRADLDKLKSADGRAIIPKGGEIVLADGAEVGESRDLSGADGSGTVPTGAAGVDRADVEKIEISIAQLQIKIEAMSATLNDLPSMKPSGSAAMKDDIIALEVIMKEIQDTVVSASDKGASRSGEGVALKEDTDAIETLLRNTKAQLEDMAFPDPAAVVTKDQLDAVEAVVRVTNDAIDGLVEKLNNAADKADVAVVEVLAQDLKAALDEVKDRIPVPDPDEVKPELMTKADLDVLGVMVTEIKTRVNEMQLPEPEELPSKADVEQLHGLINDFRESHDKLKESYETDIAVTAKAFDDRKQEFEDTVQQITELKDTLAAMKDELLSRVGDGENSVETLGETLRSLEEKTSHEPITTEIQSLLHKITHEFETAHGSIESLKVDHQQSSETALEKHAEHKEALATELGEKLETYFDGLMSKYDDAQHAAEEKARTMEEKATQQEEMLNSMKVMTDDLRLSIDTLGSSLASFPETVERIAEESKTVFTRVDDTFNKLDETQEGLKFEHAVTRDEIVKVIAAVAGLQSDFTEFNPRFMVTLKEVQALIGQHYEHSQRATDVAAEHTQIFKELQEQVRGIGTQNEELKSNVSSLPRLMPAPAADSVPVVVPEKYDDTVLHEKLDKLMGHAEDSTKGSVQLERLDQIHEKIMATAAEVSAFVATQAKQITEDHENKEKEAEELALLLERRQMKKDEIEDDITVLNEEKETLATAVEALKAEKEALAAQKARLAADVSSLETAMHIRREELHDMDRKAETIERRMLEGVMNQSRMLLLAKGAKSPPKKKPQGRDLRVPINASAASAQTVTSSVPALKANHSLAMKSRPVMQRNGGGANTAERRIMSLNQINHNVPYGGSNLSVTPSMASQGLKRSHSVKSGGYPRKPSWAGKRDLVAPIEDKENSIASEEDLDDHERRRSGSPSLYGSDAATERRTSMLSARQTSSNYDRLSFADGVTPSVDDSRMSYGTSDLSYGTGSYMTGSEIDRRTSLGSSANGVVGSGAHDVIDEEMEPSEEEFHELAEEEAEEAADVPAPLRIEGVHAGEGDEEERKRLYYAAASDSGLGTDMPTAALSSVDGSGEGYFRG